ncbi:MAG: hypothetical protein H8E66_10085 [Planctomycetes bacterium]|nr:hypothetical protein [Planctomycetota bacterium]
MSKQRRKRMKRNKQVRSQIRNGVEQLDKRVLPGGFLDLLAGAAIASQFDLLPDEQLVPEEIESDATAAKVADTSAIAAFDTELALSNFDINADESSIELTTSNNQPPLSNTAPSNTTNTLLANSLIDTFYATNQFIDTAPTRPALHNSSPPSLPTSFRSPISQLGAGVGSGSGQGYNVTGAELPQSNVGSSVASTSSIPAWMMGEGEDNGGASASGSASSSGSGTTTTTGTASCSGSTSGSTAMSASGYVTVYSGYASEAAGTMTFVATFSGTGPCGGFSVDFSTSDGSAISAAPDDDYSETTGTVSFEGYDGETVDIDVGIIDDDIVEPNETFTLTLDSVHDGSGGGVNGVGIGSGAGSGSGSGSGSAGGSASGVISNDDQAVVTISGATTSVIEGGTLKYNVDLSKEASEDVTIEVSIAGITATHGKDFSVTSASATIAAGDTTGTVDVPTIDDALYEFRFENGSLVRDEELRVTLSTVDTELNVVITSDADDRSALGAISDNEATPTLKLDDVSVTEGKSAQMAVSLEGPLAERAITGYIRTQDGTAHADHDYYPIEYDPSGYGNTAFTIPAEGTESGSFSISTIIDTDKKKDETFTVQADSHAANMGEGEVTIKETKWKLIAKGPLIDGQITGGNRMFHYQQSPVEYGGATYIQQSSSGVSALGHIHVHVDRTFPIPNELYQARGEGEVKYACSEWGEIDDPVNTFAGGGTPGNTVSASAELDAQPFKTAQPSADNADNAVSGRVTVSVESNLEVTRDLSIDGSVTFDPPDEFPLNFSGGADTGWGLTWGDWKITRESAFKFECVVDDPDMSP